MDWICATEEGDTAWYPRTISWWQALSSYSEDCLIPRRRFRVRLDHIRHAVVEEDCLTWPDCEDSEGERKDRCRCWQIDDGWMLSCKASAPGAVAVWRIEERPHRLRHWIRRRIRRLFYSSPRPVIWGGRVDRRAFWFDRFLTGVHFTSKLYRSDRWLGACEGELRWCRSCRATTPHSLPGHYGRAFCEAKGHGKSKAAPFAADLKIQETPDA